MMQNIKTELGKESFMKSQLLCPVCKNPLASDGRSLFCVKKHGFDLSSEGYVNLAVGKAGSGDNAEMCRARRDFLAVGYYRRFAQTLAETVAEFSHVSPALICDAGCGEGYYLREIRNLLPDRNYIGFDLAKTSVRFAAKAEREAVNRITYAVAGIFDMPLCDGACSSVVSVFAPVPYTEAYRILSDRGILVVAHPGAKHLFGFKEKLYEAPYDNVEKELSYPGFLKIGEKRSRYTVFIEKRDMKNLLLMTPYCWKTSREDMERFLSVDGFETELDFIVTVFRKDPETSPVPSL